MLNQVDAGREPWRELGTRRRNPLVLLALLLVVGTPSTGLQAEDESASPPAHAPASAAYARGTVWILDLSPRDAARWLGKREPTAARPLRRLKPAGARWLLGAVRRTADAHILGTHHSPDVGAPRLEVERLDTLTYVQDFDVEITNEAKVANPVVGSLQHGTAGLLEVRADDDAKPRWHLSVTQAQVQFPVPTFKTELTAGAEPQVVAIQLPELKVKGASRDLPPGAGWYVAGLGFDHRATADGTPRRRMLLVRVAELPPVLPVGAASLPGMRSVLLEARIVDRTQAALPEDYTGGLSALDAKGAEAWWRGASDGVLNLPSVVTRVGEEALVEVTGPGQETTRLEIAVTLWTPSRLTPIPEPILEINGAFTGPAIPRRTWKHPLSSEHTLVIPLDSSAAPSAKEPKPTDEAARVGRYLLLRATLLDPEVEK